jgi:hypothetical protein
LLPEATRRFPKIREVAESMTGIATPFTTRDLERRMSPIGIGLWEGVQMLWHAGILGVEIALRSDAIAGWRSILPERAYKRSVNTQNEGFHRWYFFVYNWEGEANELLQRYTAPAETDVHCILHPSTYEYLLPSVTTEWPIGI